MLEVKHLKFGFGKKTLLNNINFHVRGGELTRIDGPNGAGKSTMIALICGFLSGHEGSISFKGPSDFRSWTSWIAADSNGLFPSLSAIANLDFWLKIRGQSVSESTISQTLLSWGIAGDWVQKGLPTSKFSTGMKRRVALARLELENSRLWLLDEPLFGLDEEAYAKFKRLLDSHLASGGATVVVTHDGRLVEGLPHQTVSLGERHA